MSVKQGRAIIAEHPKADVPGPNLHIEDVEVGEPGEDEVLVEIIASGVCHTDIVLASVPAGVFGVQYPKVVGHEGSGYVRGVGKGVTSVAVGDPVLLSFNSCKKCGQCQDAHPAYCDSFLPLNMVGVENGFKAKSGNAWGGFFGQSSFASLSVVSEACVLNVKDLVKSKDELKLFAPLGCGLQTGAGTVINAAQAGPKDVVLVMGLGGVGMSAVMAAKIQGCKIIIGLDRLASRLDLVKGFGATHTLDTGVAGFDLVTEVKKISPGGASLVIDTTGVPFLIEGGFNSTAARGKFMCVGIAPPDYLMPLSPSDFLMTGRTIMACIEGDSVPQEFIPKLIGWYREGKFPFDKIVKFMPVEDFGKALHEMHDGSTIKPILTW